MRYPDNLFKCGFSLRMTSKLNHVQKLIINGKEYCNSFSRTNFFFDFRRTLTIDNTEWKPLPVDVTNLKYMNFGTDPATFATVIDEPFAERMAFWDSLNLPWKIDV